MNEDLLVRRSELLVAARAKVPGVRITANELPGDDEADRRALIAEINELQEFVDRPTPGLHLDTEDTTEEEEVGPGYRVYSEQEDREWMGEADPSDPDDWSNR